MGESINEGPESWGKRGEKMAEGEEMSQSDQCSGGSRFLSIQSLKAYDSQDFARFVTYFPYG